MPKNDAGKKYDFFEKQRKIKEDLFWLMYMFRKIGFLLIKIEELETKPWNHQNLKDDFPFESDLKTLKKEIEKYSAKATKAFKEQRYVTEKSKKGDKNHE